MRFNLKIGVKRAIEVTGVRAGTASLNYGYSFNWLTSLCQRNQPTIRNVERVAEAFDIPLDKFLQFCVEK